MESLRTATLLISPSSLTPPPIRKSRNEILYLQVIVIGDLSSLFSLVGWKIDRISFFFFFYSFVPPDNYYIREQRRSNNCWKREIEFLQVSGIFDQKCSDQNLVVFRSILEKFLKESFPLHLTHSTWICLLRNEKEFGNYFILFVFINYSLVFSLDFK